MWSRTGHKNNQNTCRTGFKNWRGQLGNPASAFEGVLHGSARYRSDDRRVRSPAGVTCAQWDVRRRPGCPRAASATSVRGWRRCGSGAASLATAGRAAPRAPALSPTRRRVTSWLFFFVHDIRVADRYTRGPIVPPFIFHMQSYE